MHTRYRERINTALSYINKNLNNKLTLSLVAEQSCFSEYHFHRIFSSVVGETLNNYIHRRRLECAVNKLIAYPHLSLTELALNSGFSSSANFSKAVKAYFGCSASQIRQGDKTNSKIGKIHSKYGKVFDASTLYPNLITDGVMNKNEDIKMDVVIKKLNKQNLCCVQSEQGYQSDSLFKAWDQLINWGKLHQIERAEQVLHGFCYDNPEVTPIDKCRYIATLVMINNDVELKPPFIKKELPAGQYASVHVKGSEEEVNKAQMALYFHWLPDSGYEPDDHPMMVRSHNDVRDDGFFDLEIYIKLKAL